MESKLAPHKLSELNTLTEGSICQGSVFSLFFCLFLSLFMDPIFKFLLPSFCYFEEDTKRHHAVLMLQEEH